MTTADTRRRRRQLRKQREDLKAFREKLRAEHRSDAIAERKHVWTTKELIDIELGRVNA